MLTYKDDLDELKLRVKLYLKATGQCAFKIGRAINGTICVRMTN
jgi:hypothetical protein